VIVGAIFSLVVIGAAVPASAQTIVCPPDTTCIVPQTPVPAPAPVVPVVPVPVPVQPPSPPLDTWWITNWVRCFNDFGDCLVNITVDGLNVRDDNNTVRFAVVNETPVHIVNRDGRLLQVTFSCQLVQTGLWSDTAGVPIMACQQ
jgi:hypothetical protein